MEAGFLPCWVHPDGTPEVLGDDQRGRGVAAYVEKITRESGLNANLAWRGNSVTFLETKN
jgi:poly-gamma-glutamate synthesis protein (capsule biosynthesis protein)